MHEVDNSDERINKTRAAPAGRTSIANRDKPLFTSRRRPQTKQEFTTDSLNTTWIPSPSPAKNGVANPALSKPRNARGRTKGFNAALKAIEDREDNLQEDSQTGANNVIEAISASKAPKDEDPEASPSPSPRHPERHNTHTPSPSRRKLYDALVSPISDASSPPKGLAETYQQILDEEDIAGQEDSDRSTSDEQESEVAQSLRHKQYLQPHGSPSPESRRSSQRQSPSPAMQGTRDKVNGDVDDRNESSVFSRQSETSSQLERVKSLPLSRREQDQQRVNAALGAHAPSFRAAKRRSGLTIEDLRRDETSSHSGSSSHGSTANRSILSEPSLNVPPGWGRKGRHGRTWLNRTNSPNSDADVKRNSINGIGAKVNDKFKAIQDWQATAASTPLPPTAGGDSLQSPSEGQLDLHGNTNRERRVRTMASMDRIRRWESGETGSGKPYQADGIFARPRNSAIDLIREREIENLTKSAVTTNRLGELKERQSLERVGRRSASTSAESLHAPGTSNDPPLPEDITEESESAAPDDTPISKAQEWGINHEQSHQVSDSPLALLRDPSVMPILNDSSNDTRSGIIQQDSKKTDTRDLLRQLSRLSSPDPSRQSDSPREENRKDQQSSSDLPIFKSNHLDTQEPGQDVTIPPQRSTEDQVSAGGTPQQPRAEAYLKTPLVTGAWIDTPLPAPKTDGSHAITHGSSAEEKTKSKAKDSIAKAKRTPSSSKPKNIIRSLAETAPKLPKSALAAILERARKKKKAGIAVEDDDTLQLGDSTAESLEDLLASSEDDLASSSSPPSPPESSAQPKARNVQKRPPSSKARQRQRQRDASIGSADHRQLTSRLEELESSITESKHSVNSIQKRLRKSKKKALDPFDSARVSQSGTESECHEAGEFHDFIWPCEKCGHSRRNDIYENQSGTLLEWQWRPIQVLIPRLWFWPKVGKMPRLTQLGCWAILALALVVAGSVLE